MLAGFLVTNLWNKLKAIFPTQGSTETANFDFRGDGRLSLEVEEEAKDCFSWQQDQVEEQC